MYFSLLPYSTEYNSYEFYSIVTWHSSKNLRPPTSIKDLLLFTPFSTPFFSRRCVPRRTGSHSYVLLNAL